MKVGRSEETASSQMLTTSKQIEQFSAPLQKNGYSKYMQRILTSKMMRRLPLLFSEILPEFRFPHKDRELFSGDPDQSQRPDTFTGNLVKSTPHNQIQQAQVKLARVTGAEVFDVTIDIHKAPTFSHCACEILSAESKRRSWASPKGSMVFSDRSVNHYKPIDYYPPGMLQYLALPRLYHQFAH